MISCQADDLNSEDSDQFSYDEDMKPKVNLDDGPDFGDIPLQDQKRDSLVNSIQTDEGMGADLKNKIAAALIIDLTSINKAEDKKLLKYNNLYDRLRKKKNDLEILLAQRRFQIHFIHVK